MIGKAIRKHNLHGKTAASVLLKLFISGKAIPLGIVVDCHVYYKRYY